jgi:hypothetical protein
MCLRFQFCTHQSVCILYFLKKVKFVVPLSTSTSDPAALSAKKSAVTASHPRLRAECEDLRRRYQRRYSTIPCCPPAQRKNPLPNPKLGVYKHLRPGGTVRQKGSEKKSDVTADRPRIRAGCGDLRFGVYKHL